MVIWIKCSLLVYFSSLIPKMSVFTLAISCLTASNLPWFIDLTFQFPMQYCFLQNQTLLSKPVTSTPEHYFRFGSATVFFLELFLHSSPGAYWAPTNLGSSSLSVIFLPFILFIGFSQGKNTKWFAIPFSSGPHFVRTLHHDPSVLGGPTWHGS